MTFSCEKVLNPEPIGISFIDAQFESEERVVTVVNGVYSILPSMYRQYSDYASIVEVWSDDLFLAGGASDHKDGNIDVSNAIARAMWNRMYSGIQRANTVLDRIEGLDFGENSSLKDQFRGEALFLRAFFYFHLVRLYGDVPISIDEILDVEEAKLPPSSVAEVYQVIQSDLEEAINSLPLKYDGSGLGQQQGRATKDAARGLLAYVYLTNEEWKNAADLSGQVINSQNNYSLLDNYEDNFNGTNENGSESIFEIQYDGLNDNFVYPLNLAPNNTIGVQTQGGGGAGAITDTTLVSVKPGNGALTFIEAFEEGDERREDIISNYGRTESYFGVKVNGEDYVESWVSKYITFTTDNNSNNLPFLRLSDMLLIRAEALNEIGESISTAENDINIIRNRADLEPIGNTVDVTDKMAFRTAIRNERRIELAFEIKRFYDLNRWGIWKERFVDQGVVIPPVVDGRIVENPITNKPQLLFPIPQEEINNNPNAIQNEGY